MHDNNRTSISAQVKKRIGTFQRLNVEIVKDLISLIEKRSISVREVRILGASWYVHTLFAPVNAESARRSLDKNFTLADIAATQEKFREWIDPVVRMKSVNIRRMPKKLCLELARTTSPLEQGIIMLAVSQGSLQKEFTFKLGQQYLALKFNVSHQAVAQALSRLCRSEILVRSKYKIDGCYLYRYGPKIKPSVS